jgi:hypothetical protein
MISCHQGIVFESYTCNCKDILRAVADIIIRELEILEACEALQSRFKKTSLVGSVLPIGGGG